MKFNILKPRTFTPKNQLIIGLPIAVIMAFFVVSFFLKANTSRMRKIASWARKKARGLAKKLVIFGRLDYNENAITHLDGAKGIRLYDCVIFNY